MANWSNYFRNVGDRPNGLIAKILEEIPRNKRSVALDLGAGNLRDSKYLLSQGFGSVIAVDDCEQSINFVVPGIILRNMPIQFFRGDTDTINLVISCNTLFYLTNEEISNVFKEVYKCLAPGGVFVCNILGPKDGWIASKSKGIYPLKKSKVTTLGKNFSNFEVRERFESGVSSDGAPKIWHQWIVIAKK
jgi:SAM-dependent methyltransferase